MGKTRDSQRRFPIFQETLHLTVCSARNLQDADWLPFSKGSDPFCEAEILGEDLPPKNVFQFISPKKDAQIFP